jgi:serine/threonine protein kinase
MSGEQLGTDIKIHEKIGKGGFSIVNRCTDENNNEFAVKRCKISKLGIPHPQELSIMMSIKHPNINGAQRVYTPPGSKTLYIFQDLAKGDIAKIVRHDKLSGKQRPDPQTIRKWLVQLVSAVSCLHKQNIIHADIKAGNILLFDNGDIRLSDFTLAIKQWSQDLKYNHTVCTSTHRPIENHLKREWDASLDIWSLGCTIYEIIYGHLLFPYQGNLGEVKKDHLDERCTNCLIDWGITGPIKQSFNAVTTKYEYLKFNLTPEFRSDPYGINDLLLKMLMLNKDDRPTINDILKHRLFTGCPKMNYVLMSTPREEISEKEVKRILDICNSKSIGQHATIIAVDLYKRTVKMTSNSDLIRIYACIWLACKLCHKLLPKFEVAINKLVSVERSICAFLEYRLHFSG